MLFAVPLALLAAIFTSQFLTPRLRSPIKATVEMMASLPSVVLGFLAGIVVAPVAETVVPATIAACVTVPFVLLFGARLWQLLPGRVAVRGRCAAHDRDRALAPRRVRRGLPSARSSSASASPATSSNGSTTAAAAASARWMVLLLPAAVAAVPRLFAHGRPLAPQDLARLGARPLRAAPTSCVTSPRASSPSASPGRVRGCSTALARPARRPPRHLRAEERDGRRLRDGLRRRADRLHARGGRARAFPSTCDSRPSERGRRRGRPRCGSSCRPPRAGSSPRSWSASGARSARP